MAKVKVSERIEADAEAVWALLRDFGGIDRIAAGIESCTVEGEGVGALRTLRMPGGAEIRERLEALDEAAKTLRYSIVGASPLPVDDYLATIRVTEEGSACVVEWEGSFEPRDVPLEKVAPLVEGIYRGGIRGVREVLGA